VAGGKGFVRPLVPTFVHPRSVDADSSPAGTRSSARLPRLARQRGSGSTHGSALPRLAKRQQVGSGRRQRLWPATSAPNQGARGARRRSTQSTLWRPPRALIGLRCVCLRPARASLSLGKLPPYHTMTGCSLDPRAEPISRRHDRCAPSSVHARPAAPRDGAMSG
jgi:hypothetical protein